MKIGYHIVGQTTIVWPHRTSVNRPDYNIPTEFVPTWHPSTLYPGAVVLLIDERPPSPVTGRPDEPYVHWVDASGRVNTGWIAKTTPLRRTDKRRLSMGQRHHEHPMSAWDQMRWRAGWPIKFGEPAVKHWLFTYGREHVPLLQAVVREWGGHYKKDDDAVTLIRQIVEQIFHETLERIPNMGDKSKKGLTKKGPLSGREAVAALRAVQSKEKKGKGKKAKSDVIDLRGVKQPRSKTEEKKMAAKAAKKAKKADKPAKSAKKAKKAAKVGKPVDDKKIKAAFKRWKDGESMSSVQNDLGRSLTGPFMKLAGSKEAFFKLRAKGAGGRRFDT